MIQIEVHDEEAKALLAEGKRRMATLAEEMARDLEHRLERESRSASRRVAESWSVEPSAGDTWRIVSDVFFTSYLAKGTRGSQPKQRPRLMFRVDGHWASPERTRGISAHPFVEQATQDAEAHTDQLARLFEGL